MEIIATQFGIWWTVEGFDLVDVNVCAFFFADGIVLLTPSAGGLKSFSALHRDIFDYLLW